MNATKLKKYWKQTIALVMSTFMLSGCQPTPDTEAIARKDDINKVVEQYADDDSVGETAGEQQGASAMGESVSDEADSRDGSKDNENGSDRAKAEFLRQSIGAPETVSFEVSVENIGDGSTKVTADNVPIILPNVDKLGSASVVRGDLTAEQVKAIADKFFDGRTAYEQAPQTKEDYLEQIQLVQQSYDENLADGVSEEELAWLKEQIALIESEMAEAPARADVQLKTADFQWKDYAGVSGLQTIYGSCTENGIQYTLNAQKETSFYYLSLNWSSVEDIGASSYLVSREGLEKEIEAQGGNAALLEKLDSVFATTKCRYTQEQAVKLCMDFLNDYNIDTQSLVVTDIKPFVNYNYETGELGEGIESYYIYMTHGVGGVAQTRASNGITYIPSEENDGKVTYDYESLLFDVNDFGITSFMWSNPMTMGDVLADKVKLMPYNDIEDIIRRHIGMAYERYNMDESLRDGMSLDVDRITLGMMRIQNKGDEENYTLIPVWDVFSKQLGDYSLVTINAMDGSIVSRENGY